MDQAKKQVTGLKDLPPEVVLEHLLPVLADKDIATLSTASKDLRAICNTDAFWLQRTRNVFSYNPSALAPPPSVSATDADAAQETAPLSWSKRLYIGLSHPRPFIWGSEGNGRQGTPDEAPRAGAYHYQRGIRGVNRPKDASGQFERVRRRIEQLPASGGGGGGEGWLSAMGNSFWRAAGYRDQGASEGQQAHPDADTVASRRGGGEGIVELQAGGWSFAARDMQGIVWVWGQLDGTGFNMGGQGWHHPRCIVREPTPIPLPCRAEAMSMGRSHLMVLDQDNLIWEMRSWGRAYHHTAPALTSPTNPGSTKRPHHIIQLSAGWSHSACLTSAGKVIVWSPFCNAYSEAVTTDEQLSGPQEAPLEPRGGTPAQRTVRWGTVGDIVHELEPIPERPEWDEIKHPVIPGPKRSRKDVEAEWREYERTKMPNVKEEDEHKIIKIASGADFLIALKRNGEVWFRRIGKAHEGRTTWEYLPYFSSPTISHISAGFTSITTYSTARPSRINHARLPSGAPDWTPRAEWTERFMPNELVELQGQDVIQVELGDYHTLALTARGEVYAWGQGDEGQLGLGMDGTRGQAVIEPRRVSFLGDPTASDGYDQAEHRELRRLAGHNVDANDQEEPFVFAIAAAGWHSGALVLGDPRRRRPVAATAKETSTSSVPSTTKDTPDDSWAPRGGLPLRVGHTGRMILPEGQVPLAGPHLGGPSVFRIGLPGALGVQGPAVGSPPNALDTGGIDSGTGSGSGSGTSQGGIGGTIRKWVKRSSHSGNSNGTGSGSTGSAGGPSMGSRHREETWTRGSAIAAPSEVADAQPATVGPSSIAPAPQDGGVPVPATGAALSPLQGPSQTLAQAEEPRPLTGGYAEAAQGAPGQDARWSATGGVAPAFARGAGQSRRMPGPFGGLSSEGN